MWFHKKRKKRTKTAVYSRVEVHYRMHKELARSVITERLDHWNVFYNFSFNRVSIKKQRRCWGSCSEKGNLNFNYRIIFLPEYLMDYVIVHELCHLEELNHGKEFWNLVQKTRPQYRSERAHLQRITSVPADGFPSSVFVSGREEAKHTHVN